MKTTKGTHSAKSLKKAAERIQALVAPALRIAEDMPHSGIASLTVGAQSALERAMEDCNRWARACEAAYTAELNRQGAFQAEEQHSAEQPKRKSPKK